MDYLVSHCKTTGEFFPSEIFPGCYGYDIKGEAVTCIGTDTDGRLDFKTPIFRSTLTRLANVALVGMFQESFLEMLQ